MVLIDRGLCSDKSNPPLYNHLYLLFSCLSNLLWPGEIREWVQNRLKFSLLHNQCLNSKQMIHLHIPERESSPLL